MSTARGSTIDSAGQVLSSDRHHDPENARAGALPPPTVWVPIALLAFVARLLPTLHGGGLRGIDDYDEGVYFSAAQALIAGRFPYRDFVLLHPPGIVLVLTPFAALARVVSDHRAFELARLAFMALGSINAVLTAAIARRARSGGVVAAAVAGVLYAVWPPAIDAESTTLLTPRAPSAYSLPCYSCTGGGPSSRGVPGRGGTRRRGRRQDLGCRPPRRDAGVGAHPRRGGETARVACGAAAGVTAVCLPFFLAAPGPCSAWSSWTNSNGAKRTREPGDGSRGSSAWPASAAEPAPVCWSSPPRPVVRPRGRGSGARPGVARRALLAAIVTLLLTAPSFFAHYAGYAAAPLLVLTGTGAAALACGRPRCACGPGHRDRRHVPVVALVVAVIPITGSPASSRGSSAAPDSPAPAWGSAAASSRCVTADSPGGSDPDGSAESGPGTRVPGLDRCHGPDVRHGRGAPPER